MLSTRIQSYPLVFHQKTGQVLPSVLDLLDTNRFQWKSSFSIHDRLRQISLMSDEEVESRSDGVHRIHWTRIDCPPSKQTTGNSFNA